LDIFITCDDFYFIGSIIIVRKFARHPQDWESDCAI
jgi:hypothetical protein